MVPSKSNDPSSPLVPMSVESNASGIRASRDEGFEQLEQLRRILESASTHSCLQCWITGEVHSTAHAQPRNYSIVRPQIGIRWKANTEWPFCWVCWVPFRRPCNHTPTVKGLQHEASSCPYQVLDPFSQEPSPIIPCLIALIFTFYFSLIQSESDSFMLPMADFLGLRLDELRRLDALRSWLQVLPAEPSDVPNSGRFLIAWDRFYRQRQ